MYLKEIFSPRGNASEISSRDDGHVDDDQEDEVDTTEKKKDEGAESPRRLIRPVAD